MVDEYGHWFHSKKTKYGAIGLNSYDYMQKTGLKSENRHYSI